MSSYAITYLRQLWVVGKGYLTQCALILKFTLGCSRSAPRHSFVVGRKDLRLRLVSRDAPELPRRPQDRSSGRASAVASSREGASKQEGGRVAVGPAPEIKSRGRRSARRHPAAAARGSTQPELSTTDNYCYLHLRSIIPVTLTSPSIHIRQQWVSSSCTFTHKSYGRTAFLRRRRRDTTRHDMIVAVARG